ncbi:UDP-N-acetylmuramoyl-tripeptide--D-alanyl-D- alan ine ligase [Bifidobacterium sp. DSM 109963]|uniref:UDP-N-acetylmuramoyl-tripeptide--D-alanyl-D-alanine ligase n=2 Tax=Bifidobacterium panos TaxID=2675321 RepID=A0ABX1SX14_9BIFI|nr:UDP-N-acetylmuramoyl-tripeptide--D-alanyl-D- alan ine ligase [Bifidobacterium sp. DSM 109963]
MPMTIDEIAEAVAGRVVPAAGGAHDGGVALHVVSDSRQIRRGSVFVAIKGERVDGHDYVQGAGAAGALAAIVDHVMPDADVAQIVVGHTVEALGKLAQANIVRRRATGKPFTIVAITGSVGKTTTKDLLKQLLGQLGPTVAPVGSFNNEIGLPLTALSVGEDTRYFVAEMGASHIGEIAHLTAIAPPDMAVVLKVGVAHLGEFGSVERIAQAKSEIVRGLVSDGVAVLNADDPHVEAMADIAPGSVLRFGVDGANTDTHALFARDVSVDENDRPSFTLVAGADEKERAQVRMAIPGAHNVMNALAAATVAHSLGMPLDEIARVLGEQRRISPHRMAVSQVALGEAHFTLIDDSFNANPDSMRAGLDGLARWAGRPKPYRVAVLGAMLELGGDERELHRSIGAYAAGLGVDYVIAVGSPTDSSLDALAGALAEGALGAREQVSVDWVHDTDQANALVTDIAREHDGTVVLLKGSHASGLSALAERWSADEGKAIRERDVK